MRWYKICTWPCSKSSSIMHLCSTDCDTSHENTTTPECQDPRHTSEQAAFLDHLPQGWRTTLEHPNLPWRTSSYICTAQLHIISRNMQLIYIHPYPAISISICIPISRSRYLSIVHIDIHCHSLFVRLSTLPKSNSVRKRSNLTTYLTIPTHQPIQSICAS